MIPIIIDDVIDISYQDILLTQFVQRAPWYFINDITFQYGVSGRQTPALAHLLIDNEHDIYDTRFANMITPIAYEACKRIKYKIEKITKARSFLQFPLAESYRVKDNDLLHVDQSYSHLVVLYYLADSDGETIIVNHKRQTDKGLEFNLEASDFPELVRVTPKKGRCVIFDGDYYHTAQQPINNLRGIINFNILGFYDA